MRCIGIHGLRRCDGQQKSALEKVEMSGAGGLGEREGGEEGVRVKRISGVGR